MVFFFKEINKHVLDMMLGFAAGVMVAASFWSLLAPAIEMAENGGGSVPPWAVAAMVTSMAAILPYALAFAAGAMLYVVVEELIPEAQSGGEHESIHWATVGFIFGFTMMMILDVALG